MVYLIQFTHIRHPQKASKGFKKMSTNKRLQIPEYFVENFAIKENFIYSKDMYTQWQITFFCMGGNGGKNVHY